MDNDPFWSRFAPQVPVFSNLELKRTKEGLLLRARLQDRDPHRHTFHNPMSPDGWWMHALVWTDSRTDGGCRCPDIILRDRLTGEIRLPEWLPPDSSEAHPENLIPVYEGNGLPPPIGEFAARFSERLEILIPYGYVSDHVFVEIFTYPSTDIYAIGVPPNHEPFSRVPLGGDRSAMLEIQRQPCAQRPRARS